MEGSFLFVCLFVLNQTQYKICTSKAESGDSRECPGEKWKAREQGEIAKKRKGRETLVSSRHEPRRTELATYKTEPKRADGKGKLEGNRQDSENGRVWVEGQWRRRFTYDILTILIV